MRIFKNREEINLVCLMEGKLPEKAGEMAIDRMYADNNQHFCWRYTEKWLTKVESHRICGTV